MAHFPTEEQSQGDEFGVPSLYDLAPIEGERMSKIARNIQSLGIPGFYTETVVNFKQKHFCGQVFEHAMTLKNNTAFSLEIEQKLPSFAEIVAEFALPPETPRKLKVAGDIEKVNISGVEFRDRSLFCAGCGANLLHPEEDK